MSTELETLASNLEKTLKARAGVALSSEDLRAVTETLLEEGYRLTEPTGPFIVEQASGDTRITENRRDAEQLAGERGKVLQRRRLLSPFAPVEGR